MGPRLMFPIWLKLSGSGPIDTPPLRVMTMAPTPNNVPRVAIIGEIMSQLVSRPFTNPIAKPTTSAPPKANAIDSVAVTRYADVIAPARNDAPTDRSRPPAIMTRASKQATMMTKLDARRMLDHVSGARNRGVFREPSATMRIITVNTGKARLDVTLARHESDVAARAM